MVAEPLVAPSAPTAATPAATGPVAPSAVVELFTSEGCSSCPPADESLAQLSEEAQHEGKRVFTLELHVDYWNDLGWVDPFSDHMHSVRQGAYAGRMAANRVYTPQMVVNGDEELVGSNTSGARAAIARALRAPARAAVSVAARRVGDQIELSYRVEAASAVDLQLALADDVVETRVTAGENANHVLRHRHVVRAFQTLHVAASAAGVWQPTWRAARPGGAVFVAAYATDPATLRVLGADARSVAATQ
jgi:hypothetical protein